MDIGASALVWWLDFSASTGMAATPHPFLNLEQNAEVEVATPRMLDLPTGARIASGRCSARQKNL